MVKVKIANGPHEGEIVTMNGYRESFVIPLATDNTEWGCIDVEYRLCRKKITGTYIAEMSGVSVNAAMASKLPITMLY